MKPLLIFGLILIVFTLATPAFNFPVDDDWVYIQSVEHFLHGSFRVSEYSGASTIFQTCLGYIYSTVAGFSLPKIHLLTAFFSLFGVLVAYWHLKVNFKKNSIYIPLLIFLNPYYFFLSYSFGTDVLFTALLVASIAFITRGLQTDKTWFLLTGSLLAGLSICVRQLGLAVPLGAVIFYVLTAIQKKEKISFYTLISITAPALLGLIVYFAWFRLVQLPTIVQQMQANDLSFTFEKGWTRWSQTLMYLGLLLTPVTIFQLRKRKDVLFKLLLGLLVGLGITLLYWFKYTRLMMYTQTLLTINGFAPNSIEGTKIFFFPHPLQLGIYFTLLSILGVGLLFATFSKKLDIEKITASILVGFFAFPAVHCDRYYLPVLVLLTISYGRNFVLNTAIKRLLAFSIILFLVIINLVGIVDYKAWSEVRWSLGNKLLKSGVDINQINGGYEWNAWHLAESHIGQDLDTRLGYDYTPKNPRFVITFASPKTEIYKNVYYKEEYCLPFNIKCGEVFVAGI